MIYFWLNRLNRGFSSHVIPKIANNLNHAVLNFMVVL
jgi:hypothetical protein